MNGSGDKSREGAPPLPDTPDLVTHPPIIDTLLCALRDRRALIQVGIESGGPAYRSIVLAVDRDAGTLSLDELSPDSGHARLIRARTGQAFGTHEGVALRFPITVVGVGRERGIHFYRVARPGWLWYAQRRDRHRVGLTARDAVVRLGADRGGSYTGRIVDLSDGGFGALFPANAAPTAGDSFDDCLLQLDPEQALTCTVQVTHICGQTGDGKVRAGIRFIALDPRTRTLIRQFVATLDRRAARRRRR